MASVLGSSEALLGAGESSDALTVGGLRGSESADDVSAEGTEPRDYQTLFWVPMLFQTAKSAEQLIDDMLDLIQEFHDSIAVEQQDDYEMQAQRAGAGGAAPPRRRQQIMGDTIEEVSMTRVDVVMKSETTKFTLLSVLKRHFLFSQLRDNELEDVVDVMQSKYAEEGETIIRQGDSGDLFYILEEGVCEIFVGDNSVGRTESGSSFGDLALMYNSPRAATIVARTDCTLWTLDRFFFRQAMVTSSSNQNVQLSQFLSKISQFATLSAQQLNQLARSLTKQSYDDGHYIIRQGDLSDQFYVVYKGKVRVTKTDDSGNEHFLIELGEGEVFGERALIKKEPRKANIVCNGPVECYFLESHDFYSMLGEFVEKFNKMNEFRVIRSAKMFNKLSDSRLKDFVTQFRIHKTFNGQRHVVGSDELYIVVDGVFVGTNGERYSSDGVVEIGSVDQVADQITSALITSSDEAILASFSREDLLAQIRLGEEEDARRARRQSVMDGRSKDRDESLLMSRESGDAEHEIEATAQRRRAAAHARRMSLVDFNFNSLVDLEILSPLGKGTFGSVYLCNHKRAARQVALKCLDKKAVVESGQHRYVRREIMALQNFKHPFLVEYLGFINAPRKVCFLLEYIPGGELWNYLYDRPDRGDACGLSLPHATLYAANVILALEHIHALGYVYRDLKPENLMIMGNGYLKLVDFGFAKQVPYVNQSGQILYRTFTLCGTPDYMAPELVLTQGHDRSVDYWAFGVLVYELLCGRTPFYSANQQRTFEKIVHIQRHLTFPSDFNSHSKSLIRRLLHPNAALRLGALQNGINDITNHAFFSMQAVNFEALLSMEVEMPFLPEVQSIKAAAPGTVLDIQSELESHDNSFSDYDHYFANLDGSDESTEPFSSS